MEDEKVVIKDSESMTPPPPLSSASSLSNRAMRYAIEIPHEIMTNNSGEILGVSSKHKPVKLSNHLSIMVIAYSLLTLSSILFKMKFKYAKDKTISTQPIYPP
ncbi:MAG: hypothetical protein UR89_C0041G0006 [Candidatus Roizmanbacteria bacterium GW2011_GWA2_35_8]|uniref:Uncharacterized protein n=1 Tax=Candidatus Roizmanbacteria bacterium GW2011_GWA2_35_8 TaxID=1618479 RepID=A0A0G0CXK8_9BACT|nr:MAG: hypothetical protein UR89_C0041G0006 [Candidatus Roizmanbacteria bacterium GW2011_GWA2_35_8]